MRPAAGTGGAPSTSCWARASLGTRCGFCSVMHCGRRRGGPAGGAVSERDGGCLCGRGRRRMPASSGAHAHACARARLRSRLRRPYLAAAGARVAAEVLKGLRVWLAPRLVEQHDAPPLQRVRGAVPLAARLAAAALALQPLLARRHPAGGRRYARAPARPARVARARSAPRVAPPRTPAAPTGVPPPPWPTHPATRPLRPPALFALPRPHKPQRAPREGRGRGRGRGRVRSRAAAVGSDRAAVPPPGGRFGGC